jgi:hypothetical protein
MTITNRVLFLLLIALLTGGGCVKSNEYPRILKDFVEKGAKSILPDFSYAGYHYGESIIPDVQTKVFDVTRFGALPNDGLDDSQAIQNTVNAAGESGGGIVYFPKGTFHVNMDSTETSIIRIDYNNIVMRGSGSGKDGTIIYSGNATTQAEKNSPWLSPFVFHTGISLQSTNRFFDLDKLPVYSSLQKDAKKGDNVIVLDQTEGLKAGDVIVVAMRNTSDEGDLMNHLMSPLTFDHFMTNYLNAGKDRRPSFQYFLEVERVISDSAIQLKQPLRRDVLMKYGAFVAKVPMLREVGVENFRFECAYTGGYKHHLTREHDYGWGAVCLQRVAHGWIRNLQIHNYVQTTHLVNSRNVTVSDVSLTGLDGHYGPKMYHSSDNLVYNIEVNAKYTHGPGLEGCCFGNVYKDIRLKYPSPIDLHGMADTDFCPPMYNLYENITNLTRLAGGGAPQNIPHAGEFNVLWGLEMIGYDDDGFQELFYSWVWRDPKRFKNEFHSDCHKLYLRTIVVGVHNSNKELSIEHKTHDRQDDWIYVEGLNKDMNLPSLYETQLKMRMGKNNADMTKKHGQSKVEDSVQTAEMKQFLEMEKQDWETVFDDACTDNWRENWFLDGEKASLTNSDKGMDFWAGPVRMENASHAVLWTKDSFKGEVKIDYEYTKLDDQHEAVTILYIQATGNEKVGLEKDITKWADARRVPKMSEYFNKMDLYHISYAAFDVGNENPTEDYIRSRRYMPHKKNGLKSTDLIPDYFNTGLFKKGVPHKITVIKKGSDLFMYIRNSQKKYLCHWKTDQYPSIEEGRVGLRHMWTRAARYKNFKIQILP